MAVRRASHSGTWYNESAKELSTQLENWLGAAELTHGPARAIIAPHAGYQYCGACAAFAYRQISPFVVQRIFILGPSHNVRLSGCALSSAVKYSTPFYDLQIDNEVYEELESTGHFERMSMKVDEDEHSIEMQLPYIAKVMQDYKDKFTIVPVMVGSLSTEKESLYGHIFAQYLADPKNLFIISSDFCHWGQRFRYTFYEKSWGEIHQSITTLDHKGMDTIETLKPAAFVEYLKTFSNTICGRHPISVLLQAANHLRNQKLSLKFLKYAQSSKCYNLGDSSVSYASASLIIE
ncbi:protein MEMO1 [Metopolophium dirhodum]|uniref:protein MEMO1 n=1 Tax=Metopolophium dirhodum TaxID=44670 RepID=UPI00298FCABD|nr:protein MEMO1 [Metopolophium dirhodum]